MIGISPSRIASGCKGLKFGEGSRAVDGLEKARRATTPPTSGYFIGTPGKSRF
jgi:hypothetical protein